MGAEAIGLPRSPAFRAAGAGQIRVADVVRMAVVLLVTGHLGRIPVFSGSAKEAPVLLNDLVVVAVAGIGALLVLRTRRLALDRTARMALAFAAVGGLSAVLAVPRFGLTPDELLFSLAYLARWLAYFALYLVVINGVTADDVGRVWRSLEAATVAFALFGIFQSAFLPGFAQMVYPESQVGVDWDYQGRRLVSTFLDPNFAGALLAMVLVVQVSLLATGARVSRARLAIVALALVLTLSRSSILGLLVGMLVLVGAWGMSRRVVRLGFVCAILMVPLLPWLVTYGASLNKFTIDASALGRVFSWLRALQMFADHPVIGVGFNTLGFAQRAYGFDVGGASAFGVDGGLLFIAVTTGVVGLVLYAAMLGGVVRRCRGIWRDPRRESLHRGLALGITAATVALLVHSIFVNSIVYPFLMEPLWILWGLVAVIARAPAPCAAAAGLRNATTVPAGAPALVAARP